LNFIFFFLFLSFQRFGQNSLDAGTPREKKEAEGLITHGDKIGFQGHGKKFGEMMLLQFIYLS